jgi:hypothetical protein
MLMVVPPANVLLLLNHVQKWAVIWFVSMASKQMRLLAVASVNAIPVHRLVA